MAEAKRRCYIAGPMRGRAHLNFPAFRAAAAHMQALGREAVNPAAKEALPSGLPDLAKIPQAWGGSAAHLMPEQVLWSDFDLLMGCDEIVLLPGWQDSPGARLEAELARLIGLARYELVELVPGTVTILPLPPHIVLQHHIVSNRTGERYTGGVGL